MATQMITSQIKVNGTTIEYLRRGHGRPLVLIHGIGSSCHVWDRVIEELQSDYELYAFTLPTYATKNGLGHYYNLRTYPHLLKTLLEIFNIKKPVLTGHSLGSLICLEYASAHPKNVSKLVLISSPLTDHSKNIPFSWRVGLLLALDLKIICRIVERVEKSSYTEHLAKRFDNKEFTDFLKGWSAESIARCCNDVFRKHFEALLQNVKKPMLFICGTNDTYIHKLNSAALYPLAANETTRYLSGDHFLPRKHPKILANIIRDFIQD